MDQKRDTSKKLNTLAGDSIEFVCIMLCRRRKQV